MAIVSGDILYKFAYKTAAPGNANASDGDGSLGGWISTTELTTGATHDLFDVVTGDDNAGLDVEYRCVFIHNNHATLSLQNAVVWLSAEVAGGAVAAIGIDPTAASALGATPAQAVSIADEDTAPAGVAFTAPTSKATGLSLGTLAAGEVRAIWVRRTAADTVAVTGDGATIRVEGDTAA